MLFEKLKVWLDREPRTGPENMAIDQWLTENLGEVPILRLYRWEGDWVSLGCFQSRGEGRRLFGEEPEYVRRWTGGGIVDHRNDQTYTLVIPRGEDVAQACGCERYAKIHGELARCLRESGIACELAERDSVAKSAACFEKPVTWDLLGADGAKLAGAGQRRTRHGLLHQGSVAVSGSALENFGDFLGSDCSIFESGELGEWEELAVKYRSEKWLERVL